MIVFIAIATLWLSAFAALLMHYEHATKQTTLDAEMEKFRAALLEVTITIGDALTPALRRASEQIRQFNEAWRSVR